MLMMNKEEQRKHFLAVRKNINDIEKTDSDNRIFDRFINSFFCSNYQNFLIYISVRNEPDTYGIIRYLLENNKKVAVPFCNGDKMDFYYINSVDELIEGKFGIPSVDVTVSEKVENYDGNLCIVPGVSFDNNGNRLGYGGGYYDRFLSSNKVDTLGLCYDKCISDGIPSEMFDIKMDYVLTETCLKNHKNQEVLHNG